MATLSLRTWVCNAAAVFAGRYGAVTRQAQQAGCSRQTVYEHARQIERRSEPAAPPSTPAEVPIPAPAPAAVLDEPPRPRLAGTGPAPAPRPRRAPPGAAGGDRLRHGRQPPPDRGPAPRDPRRRRPRSLDHRPLGRRPSREGQARPRGARRGLRPPRPHARPGRDLFWGRPTLVGIEPASMTAVFCHNAGDRKAETWRQQLLPFEHLEFVVSDAAKGIAAAVEQVADQRREMDPSAPPLGHGLDRFHTTQEAERVLAQEWRRVEPLWKAAEACDAQVEHAKRQGSDARHGEAQTATPLGPRRLRSSSGSSVAKRPGVAAVPHSRSSVTTAGGTTVPEPRRRSRP